MKRIYWGLAVAIFVGVATVAVGLGQDYGPGRDAGCGVGCGTSCGSGEAIFARSYWGPYAARACAGRYDGEGTAGCGGQTCLACDNAWDGYCQEKARWHAFFYRVGTPKPTNPAAMCGPCQPGTYPVQPENQCGQRSSTDLTPIPAGPHGMEAPAVPAPDPDATAPDPAYPPTLPATPDGAVEPEPAVPGVDPAPKSTIRRLPPPWVR
jgi:hypothetical protein